MFQVRLSFVALSALWAVLLGAAPALARPVAPQFGQKANSQLFTRVNGESVQAVIEIDIDHGWHLYHTELGPSDAVGKPTVVQWRGAGVEWLDLRFPEPERLEQPGIGNNGADTWIWGHEGEITVYAIGRVTGEPMDVSAQIRGLTCEDTGSCVPYKQSLSAKSDGADSLFEGFPADMTIANQSATGAATGDTSRAVGTESGGVEPSNTPEATEESQSFEDSVIAGLEFTPQTDVQSRSLMVWVMLAFLAGLLLNVMPCVLPVISIKVLSFVQQAGEERGRVFRLGLAFAAGILVVFWVLAGAAISASASWGEQFQSETFLVTMIGIVFAFSLSLFGVFELGVPSSLGAMAGPPREGVGDAFFKGMLATVLATPCSGPFLGSTLTWTLDQTPATIFLIFTSLGVGMALPYVILTANPAFLKLVPKPGPWMETFKQAMGFVLLATVIYLMISLRQDMLLFTAAFLVFVGLACWWYGRFATFDKTRAGRTVQLVIALAIAGLGARIAFVEFRGMFATEGAEGFWTPFEANEFAAHLENGQSVMLDFTADWCPNCKYNEHFVYESDEVKALLKSKGVAVLQADITHNSPLLEGLLERLGSRSIPYVAFFSGDNPYEPVVLPDVVKISQVTEILNSFPNP